MSKKAKKADVVVVPWCSSKGRMETGPVQFGAQDWPGVFIRGDNAAFFSGMLLGIIMKMRAEKFEIDHITEAALRGLAFTLKSCIVGEAKQEETDAQTKHSEHPNLSGTDDD